MEQEQTDGCKDVNIKGRRLFALVLRSFHFTVPLISTYSVIISTFARCTSKRKSTNRKTRTLECHSNLIPVILILVCFCLCGSITPIFLGACAAWCVCCIYIYI